jgi:hypothetical protein
MAAWLHCPGTGSNAGDDNLCHCSLVPIMQLYNTILEKVIEAKLITRPI